MKFHLVCVVPLGLILSCNVNSVTLELLFNIDVRVVNTTVTQLSLYWLLDEELIHLKTL